MYAKMCAEFGEVKKTEFFRHLVQKYCPSRES